jgi:hypothetical protein
MMRGDDMVSPLAKQSLIKEYALRMGIKVFVETGTYLGDTLWASKKLFRELFSIELDSQLFESARKRFAKYKNIHLYCGDSAKVLPVVLDLIREPCLFWLDAHDSSGITAAYPSKTPIRDELISILTLGRKGDVVLIDDVLSFATDPSYPSLDQIRALCARYYPHGDFTVTKGVIVFKT